MVRWNKRRHVLRQHVKCHAYELYLLISVRFIFILYVILSQ